MSDRDAWATPEPKPLSAPPAVPEIERQLLGAVLAKPSLYEALADVVQARHFSEDAYERLWALIASMNDRGVAPSMQLLLEPAGAELQWERKDVSKLLAGLVAGAVGTVSAFDYAKSLRDVWQRRELWQASVLIQDRVRRGDLESSGTAILEEIEAKLYALGEATDTEERAQTLGQALNEGLRQAHEAAEARDAGRLVGAPTGLAAIDKKLGGFRDSDLIVVASRPGMGKTAWALKVARSAAEYFMADAGVKRPKWVMFFSLEMGADQLALRWGSSAGHVNFSRIRNGEIGAEEMMRLNESAKLLQDLPIWIDDSAALSVPAMRMRARRLARRKGGLGLIVLDYLQLVGLTREQAKDAGGNRVQEVSVITRGLKRLAKDLGVPVLALSQLSRAVEQREDKRPQLSDLRESGCLVGETLIYSPTTGKWRRIDEMVGERVSVAAVQVDSVDRSVLSLKARSAFFSGVKPVYRLATGSGRIVRATANHKFFTPRGWVALGDILPSDKVAVPTFLPGPNSIDFSGDECVLLGHLIGDGCVLARHATQYTTTDRDLAQIVVDAAIAKFGARVAPRIRAEGRKGQAASWLQVYLPGLKLTHGVRSPIHEWFDGLGIGNLRSWEKRIPASMFTQSHRVIANFLHHLWATDGCVSISERPTRGTGKLRRAKPTPRVVINYTSTSGALADGVHDLLLRVGVKSAVRRVDQGSKGRPRFDVVILGTAGKLRFVERVGVAGARKTALCNRAAELLRSRRDALDTSGHIYWDSVVSIVPDGIEPVYDIEVPFAHNFIAGGVLVHNSIEQDADLVAFLYREAYYLQRRPPQRKERETEVDYSVRRTDWSVAVDRLKDQAEFLLEKNRHGATGTMALKFIPEIMLFSDDTPGDASPPAREQRINQMRMNLETDD